MLDYNTTMAIGQARYQDVIDHLNSGGLPAMFTQTGGMCAALEVVLDSGHTLLITDADDTLSWERGEHQGWGVSLYPPDQANTDGECLAFDSVDDGAPAALLPLIDVVLSSYRRHPRNRPLTGGA